MTNNIILSEDQQSALEKIQQFIHSTNKVLTISGNAGSGKTFLMKYLINILIEIDYPYYLCAPTHRACMVLESFTKNEVYTLHQLLSLQPIVDILNLDFAELEFYSLTTNKFPNSGLIIIDESSMISDALYDLLMKKIDKLKTKILFLADDKQLQPVKNLGLSKVFDINNTIKLTNNHRQESNNKILPVLLELRTHSKRYFEPIENVIYTYSDIKLFISESLPLFKKMMNTQNINEVKLLAYTNKRVAGLNSCIRRCLFKDELQFHEREILTGYENIEYNSNQFWNSMDYIIARKPIETERHIPNFLSLPGYDLELYDSVYKRILPIFILSNDIPEDYINSLANTIEEIRTSAVTYKNINRTKSVYYWKKYYAIINNFGIMQSLMFNNRTIKKKTFDYGYAISTHKSQGTTLNNVFIDMRDINICKDPVILRQLQYVAMSRTKNKVYLFQ